MEAEKFLQALLNRYSTIYGNRIQLLDHIFSVVGNGFEWKNGEIIASDQDGMLKELVGYLPKGDVSRAEQFQKNKSVYHILGKEYTLYPLTDSSLIFSIPDDVREDWLAVAIEWIEYLSTHRKYTEHDAYNEFTRNNYTNSSNLLEKLANQYLHKEGI